MKKTHNVKAILSQSNRLITIIIPRTQSPPNESGDSLSPPTIQLKASSDDQSSSQILEVKDEDLLEKLPVDEVEIQELPELDIMMTDPTLQVPPSTSEPASGQMSPCISDPAPGQMSSTSDGTLQVPPSTSDTEINVQDLCRVCAETSRDLQPVFGTSRLAEKINLCLPITVFESDSLPLQVCRSCVFRLDLSYQLATLCQQAQVKLTELLNIQLENNVTTLDEVDYNEEQYQNSPEIVQEQPHAPTPHNIPLGFTVIETPEFMQTHIDSYQKTCEINPESAEENMDIISDTEEIKLCNVHTSPDFDMIEPSECMECIDDSPDFKIIEASNFEQDTLILNQEIPYLTQESPGFKVIAAPDFEQGTPNLNQKIPDLTQESPGFKVIAAPDFEQGTPNLNQKIPDLTQESCGFKVIEAPDFQQNTPNLNQETPDLAQKPLECNLNQSPDLAVINEPDSPSFLDGSSINSPAYQNIGSPEMLSDAIPDADSEIDTETEEEELDTIPGFNSKSETELEDSDGTCSSSSEPKFKKSVPSFNCEYCSKNFDNRRNMTQHVRNVHTFWCKICITNIRGIDESILETHNVENHPKTSNKVPKKVPPKNLQSKRGKAPAKTPTKSTTTLEEPTITHVNTKTTSSQPITTMIALCTKEHPQIAYLIPTTLRAEPMKTASLTINKINIQHLKTTPVNIASSEQLQTTTLNTEQPSTVSTNLQTIPIVQETASIKSSTIEQPCTSSVNITTLIEQPEKNVLEQPSMAPENQSKNISLPIEHKPKDPTNQGFQFLSAFKAVPRVKCKKCLKTFKTQLLLNKHVCIPHFVCRTCKVRFVEISKYKSHHCVRQLFCDLCLTKFRTPQSLRIHTCTSTSTCKYCNSNFKNNFKLKNHKCSINIPKIEQKNSKVIKCKKCKEIFNNLGELHDHLSICENICKNVINLVFMKIIYVLEIQNKIF